MDGGFPFESGLYTVTPGLKLLDSPAFLCDGFERYCAEKRRARAQRTTYLEHRFAEATRAAAFARIVELLVGEHPELFHTGSGRLHCRMTGSVIDLAVPDLDALLSEVCEDVAVFQIDGETERLAAAQISMPSSWRLEEKIGRTFSGIHQPVPGMDLSQSSAMVRSLAKKGPYERFAWGLTNHDVLDQYAPLHDCVLPGQLYVRVERQTTHPLPDCDAWIFTIRPSNTPVEALSAAQRESLASAVGSMSEAQAAYKGVLAHREAIIAAIRRVEIDTFTAETAPSAE